MTYQVPGTSSQQPLVRTWALPASSIYNEGFGGNVRYYRNQYEYHQYHTYRVYRSNLSFLMFSHGHVTAKNRRKMHFFTKRIPFANDPAHETDEHNDVIYIFLKIYYLLGTGPSTPTSLRIHRVHYNMTVLYHVGSPTFN